MMTDSLARILALCTKYNVSRFTKGDLSLEFVRTEQPSATPKAAPKKRVGQVPAEVLAAEEDAAAAISRAYASDEE